MAIDSATACDATCLFRGFGAHCPLCCVSSMIPWKARLGRSRYDSIIGTTLRSTCTSMVRLTTIPTPKTAVRKGCLAAR